ELVRHIDSIEEKLNLLAEDLSKLKQGLSLINNQNSEQQKLRLNG
ncbi:MAG: hypothetical protein HZA78_06635, partial [Candidatus Schekmanbacteria bacterium]|nr:hypothetical protein [Candidatus Schekmanbacteria bacterium]MBI5788510.1 hypothetical protein [Candidatus Schekmanbacteria bacterium]